MNPLKQWTAAALALALTVSISPVLAAPAAEPFADFRIDASDMDVPDRILSVELYHRDESGSFLPEDNAAYYGNTLNCKVNRVTGDAMFYIQPKSNGVWVTVDYLTDVNGDGIYELLDGGDRPVWDTLGPLNNLMQGGKTPLVRGKTYTLSAETLSLRFEKAAQARSQDWELESDFQTFPLCRMTLRRTNAADGQEYEQLYYLEICGQILASPIDVPRDRWYYSAVEYSLAQGWFVGLEDGRFGPDEPLSRSQLAKVLWTMEGSPALRREEGAQTADFTDVVPTDWFSQAVAWCRQEGLMSGYEDGTFLPSAPLTREQLASVLWRYENYAGYHIPAFTSLSQYSDADFVSPWAYDSMRWAVSNGLLSVFGNSLRPGDAVTRAELAFALYTLQTIGQSQTAVD